MQSPLLLLLPVITIICSHVFCDIAANATENNKAEKATKREEAFNAGRRGQRLPLANPIKRKRERESNEKVYQIRSLTDHCVLTTRVNLSQINDKRGKDCCD